ncbi:Uncharacterized protein MALG_01703 [Marinovum algicola DG 898]|nr:Uncharacterized protein MALG_01703 [Marinovum algicola DG 898]
MLRTTALLAALVAPLAAQAQDLPTSPYLPLAMASDAANAALEACAAESHNVSVAIVARDGNTKVLLKADNSGPHTASSATGKAFTSVGVNRHPLVARYRRPNLTALERSWPGAA